MKTVLSEMLKIELPIIGAPMFLVSNADLVSAVSNAGGIGGIPALNFRSTQAFQEGIQEIKKKTNKPYAVNLIVNQANPRATADLEVCVAEKVPLVITSLGNPQHVIQKMHAVGSHVFCDVVNLEYAQKVEKYGADAVIAVCSGAGGHAGPISPLVLLPYLKKNLKIPLVAAGGIATGEQILAAFILGASAVQIGTRFIASTESQVDTAYKQAVINASPEDIVLTKKISGTPASVINTPYIQKQGLELSWIESTLLSHKATKKYMKMLISYLGSLKLTQASEKPTWKTVWSAGQGVGLIESVEDSHVILQKLKEEFEYAKKQQSL
jgi:nitronate monooxygenase